MKFNIENRKWRFVFFGIAPILILYLFTAFFWITEYKVHRRYDPGDDRYLFSSESSVYYHYTQVMASGEKLSCPDKQIQAPEGLDPKREFTLVMQWLVANLYRLSGQPGPLHGFIIIFTGVISSIAVATAWLLALRLTGSLSAAILAALCYGTSFPAYSRTLVGYQSENFALPLLFLGLALFVRGYNGADSRIRTFFAAACFAAAAASWHFSQFVLLLLVAWYWIELLRTGGDSRITGSAAWLYVLLVIAGIASPALRARFFFISPLMIFLPALIAASRFPSYRWFLICAAAVSVPLTGFLFPEHFSDFNHVYRASWEKLVHAGIKPPDPASLSFDTRMFWTGPFDTPLLSRILTGFAIYLIPGVTALIAWIISRRGENSGTDREGATGESPRESKDKILPLFFAAVLIPVYMFNSRFCVFLSFFIIQAAVIASVGPRKWPMKLILVLILGFQGYETVAFASPEVPSARVFLSSILDRPSPVTIERSRKDTRDLYNWLISNAGEEDIVLAAPALSADLLQAANVRVALHPMFEKRGIRERTERFYKGLYGDSFTSFERFCKETEIDLFVYDVNFLLPSSTSSHRYFGGAGSVHRDMPAYNFQFSPERATAFKLEFQNNVFRIYRFFDGADLPDPSTERMPVLPIYDPGRFSLARFDEDAIRFIKGYNFARRLFFTAGMQVVAGRPQDALPLLERIEEYFPGDPTLKKLLRRCRGAE